MLMVALLGRILLLMSPLPFLVAVGCAQPAQTPTADVPATREAALYPLLTPLAEPQATLGSVLHPVLPTTAAPQPEASSTPIPTDTPTLTPHPTATSTPIPTHTPTVTPQPTATSTPVPTLSPKATSKPTATSTPVPTPTPVSTPSLVTLLDFGDSPYSPIAHLRSFKHTLTLEFATTGDEGQLVFGLTVVGEFEGPHSLTCRRTVRIGGLTISADEIVAIGSQVWINEGDGWEASTFSYVEVTDLLDVCVGAPDFWDSFGLAELVALEGESGEIDGVPATRIDLSGQWEDALTSGFSPGVWEEADVEEFVLWMAEDGGWPVSFSAKFAGSAKTFGMSELGLDDDAELTVEMIAHITDADNPEISVLSPTL